MLHDTDDVGRYSVAPLREGIESNAEDLGPLGCTAVTESTAQCGATKGDSAGVDLALMGHAATSVQVKENSPAQKMRSANSLSRQ